ncbi:TIGR03668 family PPOX class F420-dependent oxidoreductase [Nocardiopsis quinghaiensis]|uniref:TIGR03668 family PPOX class F420-dependent oxidoreductase n=1 Tax=Nocardiopsis quinghaiensis TaxID=464995 RepID=UPI00123A0F35|nr:TIGR03668 family PPOX class F420-dependent oxidoreductase [Nocardiopsis quinghaiensis]
MRWSPEQARERFARSRVARLATVDDDGQPHLVPVVFAAYDNTVAIPVDHKPKATYRLKRVRNIEGDPRVSLLADEYSDDWDRLWWARADGEALVQHSGPAWDEARERLAERYSQYRAEPPGEAIILVEIHRWAGWSMREAADRPDR